MLKSIPTIGVVASVAAVVIGAAYFLRTKQQRRRGPPVIDELWIYPVKGCKGVAVRSARVTPHGFEFDREWVIVRTKDNAVLTQREFAKMALIDVRVDTAASTLTLSAPQAATFTVPLDGDAPASPAATQRPVPVTLWKVSGEVTSLGLRAAAWVSAFLEVDCFLARVSRDRVPHTSPNHFLVSDPKDAIKLQDYSSLHIITREGIDEVQRRVGPTIRIDSKRFRPNIVVKGVAFPEEDQWDTVCVQPRGSDRETAQRLHRWFRIRVAKLCGRCSVPTIDPETGKHGDSYQPINALRADRDMFYHHQVDMADLPGKQRWPMFGLNVFHEGTGEMSVGDEIHDVTVATASRHN